jgi:hypothetical protein
MGTFQLLLDWSEVWAPLIPLGVIQFRRHQPPHLQPVLVYLWLALLLNLSGNLIADFKRYFPDYLQSNTVLYSVHSIVRFTCFTVFFLLIRQTYFRWSVYFLVGAYALLCLLNFSLLEDLANHEHLNGNLLTIEAYLLLIFCMLYYLSQLRDEIPKFSNEQEFWIVTGLSIYVVVNFFVFLFYVPMIRENPDLAERMWSVHNVSYISMCLFITKAFYVPVRPQH